MQNILLQMTDSFNYNHLLSEIEYKRGKYRLQIRVRKKGGIYLINIFIKIEELITIRDTPLSFV